MRIRLRGALVLAGCGLYYAMLFTTVLIHGLGDGYGSLSSGFMKGVLVALPGAPVLIGLLELSTGVPFSNLSRRWDLLCGWQRALLGLLLAGGALLLGAAGFFFHGWMHT